MFYGQLFLNKTFFLSLKYFEIQPELGQLEEDNVK